MAENAEESVFSAEVVGSAPNKESGAHVPSTTIDANGSEAVDGQLAAAVASRGSEGGDGQPRRLESAASRGSVHSSLSRISMSPCQRTTPYGASKLMAYKEGAIENALEICKKSLFTPEEGDVIGTWLLVDIDLWDFEREKLVILTTNSMLVVRFDFINSAVKYFKHIPLKNIQSVDIGDFVYPSYSFMGTSRDYGGLRIRWSKDDPWFYQRWNPWCDDVGFITLTHHILIYNEKEHETTTYNVSDLADSLVLAVNDQKRKNGESDMLAVSEGPITIHSYASVGSLIFNQSRIGYNMDRGGVSY